MVGSAANLCKTGSCKIALLKFGFMLHKTDGLTSLSACVCKICVNTKFEYVCRYIAFARRILVFVFLYLICICGDYRESRLHDLPQSTWATRGARSKAASGSAGAENTRQMKN